MGDSAENPPRSDQCPGSRCRSAGYGVTRTNQGLSATSGTVPDYLRLDDLRFTIGNTGDLRWDDLRLEIQGIYDWTIDDLRLEIQGIYDGTIYDLRLKVQGIYEGTN